MSSSLWPRRAPSSTRSCHPGARISTAVTPPGRPSFTLRLYPFVPSAGSFLSHQLDAGPRQRALFPTPHTHIDHHHGPVIFFSLWAHFLFLSLKCQGPFMCCCLRFLCQPQSEIALSPMIMYATFWRRDHFILLYFSSLRIMCRGLLASKDRLTHPCCPFTCRHMQIICFEMFNDS